jgi:flagellar motor protein MotB
MPVGDNSTADGRARNRRVEIVLSGGLLATP